MALTSNKDEVTVGYLNAIIYSTRPNYWSKDIRGDPPLHRSIGSTQDCDEVYPNLFIGDCGAAKNKEFLKSLHITHVVNSAEGKHFGMVDTNTDYYKDVGIHYLGLKLLDLPMTNIAEHFYRVAEFIQGGLLSEGKVFVNCLMGISRSSTCVLAYLMIKEGMSVEEAIKLVRQRRDIRPNDGFLKQLIELDKSLETQRISVTKL